jgi:hypothetical protein
MCYYCTSEKPKAEKVPGEEASKHVEIFPKLKEQFKNKDFKQYLRLIPKLSDIGKSTSLTYPDFKKVSLVDVAKSKLYEIQNFYDEFSGMSDVKTAQNKVIQIQVYS